MTDAARRAQATVDVLQTMDANVWAAEFMRLFQDRKEDIDHGLMLAWFANAIMHGFDEATRKYDAALADAERAGMERAAVLCEAEALIDDERGYYGKEMAKAIRTKAIE